MKTIYYTLFPDTPLTPEQKAELNALQGRPIICDEDCPELTPDRYERLRKATEEHAKRKCESKNA